MFAYQTPRSTGGGGDIRSYHLVRMAVELFDVTLVISGGIHGTGDLPADLAARCEKVIQPEAPLPNPCPTPASRVGKWFRLLKTVFFPWKNDWIEFNDLAMHHLSGKLRPVSLPGRLALLSYQFYSLLRVRIPPLQPRLCARSWQRVRDRALQVAAEGQFDVFWAEHTLGWHMAEDIIPPHIPVICSSHNVEYLITQRLAEKQGDSVSEYLRLEILQMRRMEERAWRRSAVVIQCSDEDSRLTHRIVSSCQTMTVPNGVDVGYFHADPKAEESTTSTLLLTAGFNYAPNREGLTWFIRRIFPLIRSEFPEAEFLFSGSNAQAAAEEIGELPDGVRWISSPDDIRPSFRQSLVYVVPLLSGGGTRLKIFEAMAMSLPVVSTTIGAEGVPYEHDNHLLLADSPDDFATAVVQLLRSKEKRSQLRTAAKAFVEDGYTWEAICQQASDQLAILSEARFQRVKTT